MAGWPPWGMMPHQGSALVSAVSSLGLQQWQQPEQPCGGEVHIVEPTRDLASCHNGHILREPTEQASGWLGKGLPDIHKMGIPSNWLLRASFRMPYREHSHRRVPIFRDSSANVFLRLVCHQYTKPLVTHELAYTPTLAISPSRQSGQLLRVQPWESFCYRIPALGHDASTVHLYLMPSNCKGPSVNLVQTVSSSTICQSQKDKGVGWGRLTVQQEEMLWE